MLSLFQNQVILAGTTVPNIDSSVKIENLIDLARAFTQGLQIDFTNEKQRELFYVYRICFFGDPQTDLNHDTDAVLIDEFRNGVLAKTKFDDVIIENQENSYPVTAQLESFIKKQKNSAAKRKNVLFKVGEDQGAWKKILQYRDPPELQKKKVKRSERKHVDKQAEKKRARDASARFVEWLDSKISPENRAQIADEEIPFEERASQLFHFLKRMREELVTEQKNAKPISLALVDTINCIGFLDEKIKLALASPCGRERVLALRQLLIKRDDFAMKLGFEGHFAQVLNDYNVRFPSGVSKANEFEEQLDALERDILEKAIKSKTTLKRVVRLLSLTESPFRSCIGGSDCSSRTYLTKALDPNYHYFAITDEDLHTSGHVTVVLGKAKHDQEELLVAFVDKVQNVSNFDLPTVLEAIRATVKKHGYTLALPIDLGDSNGISNDANTRSGIAEYIDVDAGVVLTDFTPLKHDRYYRNAYSRADERLSCHPVKENTLNDVTFALKPAATPWTTSNIDITKLIEATNALKYGSEHEKERYLHAMRRIQNTTFFDNEYWEILKTWLHDSLQPSNLRKQAFLVLVEAFRISFSEGLDSFSLTEKLEIINLVFSAPRYRMMRVGAGKFIPFIMSLEEKQKRKIIAKIFGDDPLYLEIFQISNDASTIEFLIKVSSGGIEDFERNNLSSKKYLMKFRHEKKFRDLIIKNIFPKFSDKIKQFFDLELDDESLLYLISNVSEAKEHWFDGFDARVLLLCKNSQSLVDEYISSRFRKNDVVLVKSILQSDLDSETKLKACSRLEQTHFFHNLTKTDRLLATDMPRLHALIVLKDHAQLREQIVSESFAAYQDSVLKILDADHLSEENKLLALFCALQLMDVGGFSMQGAAEVLVSTTDRWDIDYVIALVKGLARYDIESNDNLVKFRNDKFLRELIIEKVFPKFGSTIKQFFELELDDENLVYLLSRVSELATHWFDRADARLLLFCQNNPALVDEYLSSNFRKGDRVLAEKILYSDLDNETKLKAFARLEKRQYVYNLKDTDCLIATDMPRLHALIVLKDHAQLRNQIIKESFGDYEEKFLKILDAKELGEESKLIALFCALQVMDEAHWYVQELADIIIALKDNATLRNDILDYGFGQLSDFVKLALSDPAITKDMVKLLVKDLWQSSLTLDKLIKLKCHARTMTAFKASLEEQFIALIKENDTAVYLAKELFLEEDRLSDQELSEAMTLLSNTSTDDCAESLVNISHNQALISIRDWFINENSAARQKEIKTILERRRPWLNKDCKVEVINIFLGSNRANYSQYAIEDLSDAISPADEIVPTLINTIKERINKREIDSKQEVRDHQEVFEILDAWQIQHQKALVKSNARRNRAKQNS